MVSQKFLFGLGAVSAVAANAVQLPFNDHFDKGLGNWTNHGVASWNSHWGLLEGHLMKDSATWFTVSPDASDYTIVTGATAINYPGVANGVVFRVTDGDTPNYYSVGLRVNNIDLSVWKDGEQTVLKRSDWLFRPGFEQDLQIQVTGSNIKVWCGYNEKPVIEVDDSTHKEGGVGYFIEAGTETGFTAFFRSMFIYNEDEDEQYQDEI